jgi:NAD(P)H-dependent FMN reductase
MAEYPLPLFSEDLESEKGMPDIVATLREHFERAAAFVIATPEYNGSFTPLLKNALDWCSRPTPNGNVDSVYRDKPVALVSASPGRLGGMRSLYQTRYLVENLGMVTFPGMHGIGNCTAETFANIDAFAETRDGKALRTLATDFDGFMKKFAVAD